MCFCLSLIYKKGGGRNYLEMMLLTRDSLIHKICKQFIQLNIKNKQANQKMGRRPEWSVFKEDIAILNVYAVNNGESMFMRKKMLELK